MILVGVGRPESAPAQPQVTQHEPGQAGAPCVHLKTSFTLKFRKLNLRLFSHGFSDFYQSSLATASSRGKISSLALLSPFHGAE